jgi:cytochrome c oxidase subunit 2
MFSGASNFVHGVDKAFFIILGISFFFLIGLTMTMLFFVVKYNRKKNKPAVQIKDNTWLEITWTLIPVILVLLMFYYGYEAFIPMRNAPKDAMQVKVTARMWKWSFEYKDGKESDSLVLPLNKAVKLNLESKDVIHGFYIPAFRIKEDVVPGKHNYTWFIPQEIGQYDLFCSSYCGVRHSYMEAQVVVVSEAEFNKWLAALPEKSKASSNEGLTLLQNTGCLGCHSIDGSKIVGPTFKGLYGSTVELEDDDKTKKITADSTYLKESIYSPDKEIVAGYQKGIMKSYSDVLKDSDVTKIVEYLKTLK